MSDETHSLRAAIQLAQSGALTPQAARAMTALSCVAWVTRNGEVGIIYRENWYTPEEFNALVAADTAPDATSDDGYAQDGWAVGVCADPVTPQATDPTIAALRQAAWVAAQDERDAEGQGAALWAIGAACAVGLGLAVFALWALAHGWRQ
jgi:hypothetical protein